MEKNEQEHSQRNIPADISFTSPDLPFEIKTDFPPLEGIFRVLPSIAANQCKGTVGYTKEKLLEKAKVIYGYGEELANVSNPNKRILQAEHDYHNLKLKEKLREVDERCEDLLVEVMAERQDLNKKQEEHKMQLDALDTVSKELKRYIIYLEKH